VTEEKEGLHIMMDKKQLFSHTAFARVVIHGTLSEFRSGDNG